MAGGWTQTPNFIYDLMPSMKEAEMKVVMAVVRKTVGWQCERVKLRMADLEQLTGLSHPSVTTGIKAAMKRGVLNRVVDGESFTYWICEPSEGDDTVKNFNSESDSEGEVLEPESKNSLPSAVKNFNPETVKNLNTNKRNINTNKPKKEEGEKAPAPPAPTVVSSGVPGARKLRLDSPYLKGSKFVNGFIPPGTGRNAVEVYYERFEIGSNNWRLTAPQEDDLVRQCKDLVLLREVVTAYDQANFEKPRNMRLIFDWYREPSRFREGHNGQNRRNNQANYRQPEVAQFTTTERDTYNAQQIAAGRPF